MDELQDLSQTALEYEAYLTFAKEIGDKQREKMAYEILGFCYVSLRQYAKAVKYQEMGLNIEREIENKQKDGIAYRNLGICYQFFGQYDKAIKYVKLQLTIAREIGDKQDEGNAYGSLGICCKDIGQYAEAIMYTNLQLTIAGEVGDKRGEGHAYSNLGDCYKCLGQYVKAITYQEIGLNIAKETGNKQGEANAYISLGNCYQHLGQYAKVIKYQEMGLGITREIGDKLGEVNTYTILGTCYKSLGQYTKAIKYQEMALNTAREIGNKGAEGNAYGNLGICYECVGQYTKAIKNQEMGLNIAKEIRNKRGEGNANNNIGSCYQSLGQYANAIKYLEMGLNIAREIGDKEGEGKAYGNLGICYRCLGQYAKAIEYQEILLNTAREIGNKRDEGNAYGHLGIFYQLLGQYAKGIKYAELQLTIAREIGDKQGKGSAYVSIGNCYRCLGQNAEAIKYAKLQLTIARECGGKHGEANAYIILGNCYHCLGQYAEAIKFLEMALNIAREIGGKQGVGRVYVNLGIFYYSLDQYAEAESNLMKGVACYEKLFKNSPHLDKFKVSIIDTFTHIYKILILTLLSQKKRGKALIIAEKGRSLALPELMLSSIHGSQKVVTEDKVLDLSGICKVAKTLESTVFFFCTFCVDIVYTWVIQPNGDIMFHECGTGVSQQYSKNYTETDLFQSVEDLNSLINKAIGLMKPRGSDRCEDRSLSFLYPENSQPSKNKSELGFPCAAIPGSSTIPTPVAFQPRVSRPTPAQEQKTNKTNGSAVQHEAGVSTNPEEPDDSILNCLLQNLYEILLKPVRECVVGSQVVVVPEGRLALVPFAALLDENGKYLVDSIRLRLVPSLTTAKMIRERPVEPTSLTTPLVAGDPEVGTIRKGDEVFTVKRLEFAKKEVETVGTTPLIVGDPEVGTIRKGDKVFTVQRLQFAKKEVETIGTMLKVKPLVGKRATKQKFLQNVENASLIHISAHGDAERGEILLAPSSTTRNTINNAEDIMLVMSDLEGKHIKAKLVVLSCCYSGCGEVRGEGVVGIARAFLGAGARAVLATLWAVDDDATSLFMYSFYKHLLRGKSANEALNKAMKALKGTEKFRHPRYWAPFALLGEDVTLFSKP